MKRKIWHRRVIPALCMAIGIGLLTICLCLWQGAVRANESPTHTFLQEYKVLIDPGHGGSDGGATGIRTQAREAEINLDIACKLRDQLRLQGAQVVMTREDEGAVGKDKNTDMRNRRTMIENAGQDITVSIHQNSFPDSSVCGAQVIYAPGSEKGMALAACIQAQLDAELKPEKPRSITEGDYYIVKSGTAPAVIVECGFISNEVEEALLLKDAYRQRIAEAIAKGIADYLVQG